MSLLNHISDTTGMAKSAIVNMALLSSLSSFVEQADSIKKRSNELNQQFKMKGKKDE